MLEWDSEVEGVICKFGAKGMNKNGRKLIELCMEKKLIVWKYAF